MKQKLQSLLTTADELHQQKQLFIDEESANKSKEEELIGQIDINKTFKRQATIHKEAQVQRDYDAKYALIYTNDKYDELRKLDPTMSDLPWTKNDLLNARATVSMMDIPQDNIYEFIDSSFEQIK